MLYIVFGTLFIYNCVQQHGVHGVRCTLHAPRLLQEVEVRQVLSSAPTNSKGKDSNRTIFDWDNVYFPLNQLALYTIPLG